MKKVISIIALVVAMVMAMSVSAFAADPAFEVAEGAVIPEGTTVTPAADSIAVETAATAGNYYGVLLVEGNALPTVDNAILYIDQATAADVKQAFSVLPIIPEVGTELTLYISSNVAGAELIAIPMVYDAEEEVIVPEVLLGDVDGSGDITDEDGYVISLYTCFMWDELIDQYGVDVYENEAAFVAAGDVDGSTDVTDEDGYVVSLYTCFMWDEVFEQYGVEIGDMIGSYK